MMKNDMLIVASSDPKYSSSVALLLPLFTMNDKPWLHMHTNRIYMHGIGSIFYVINAPVECPLMLNIRDL